MFSSELPRRAKRHSVPTEKSSSIFHRFLRTPNKQDHRSLDQHNRAARPAPLDLLDSSDSSNADSLSPVPINSHSPLTSDSVPPSPTLPSTSTAHSSSQSPKYSTRSDPASPSPKSVSSSTPQSHSSLARIKRSITSKTKGRRVGADPDSRLVPHSAVHNKPAVVDAEFIHQKDESLSQPPVSALLPSMDTDVKKQSKLKMWQNKGATKIKGWLNLHPSVHSSIDHHVIDPITVVPVPDHLNGHNEHIAQSQATVAHTRSDEDSLVIHGQCTPPRQENDKKECASIEQPPQEFRKSHRRRLSDIFAGKSNEPRRIPPRSSSLPRSFNPGLVQQEPWIILEDVSEYSFDDQFPLVSCIHVINEERTESSQWMGDRVPRIDPKQGAEYPEQQAQFSIIPAPASNQTARRERDLAHQKRRMRHCHQPYSLTPSTRYRRRRQLSQSDMHDSPCSLFEESSCRVMIPMIMASEQVDTLSEPIEAEPPVLQSTVIDMLHKMFPSSETRWDRSMYNPFLAIGFWSSLARSYHEQVDLDEAYDQLSDDDQ
ncbi:hypothetical protein B0O80DRAFT_251892 [Mortierella sp. GBAus27b]|nr:hypothetical protein B0O80DRAFT_251892 [Mortierella sp. GBAus27b]